MNNELIVLSMMLKKAVQCDVVERMAKSCDGREITSRYRAQFATE